MLIRSKILCGSPKESPVWTFLEEDFVLELEVDLKCRSMNAWYAVPEVRQVLDTESSRRSISVADALGISKVYHKRFDSKDLLWKCL